LEVLRDAEVLLVESGLTQRLDLLHLAVDYHELASSEHAHGNGGIAGLGAEALTALGSSRLDLRGRVVVLDADLLQLFLLVLYDLGADYPAHLGAGHANAPSEGGLGAGGGGLRGREGEVEEGGVVGLLDEFHPEVPVNLAALGGSQIRGEHRLH